MGIGEVYSRLFAKCVLRQVGLEATAACSSLNLCSGLKAGIEGAIYALLSHWDASTLPCLQGGPTCLRCPLTLLPTLLLTLHLLPLRTY